VRFPLDPVVVQYQASPSIVGLVNTFNAEIDPGLLLDDWFNKVWDVKTAQGAGLDQWGRIVGVQRVLPITVDPFTFGFDDGVGDYAPFGQAPFYNGAQITDNFSLPDNAFRALIFAKGLSNISASSSPAINEGLQLLFSGRGRCYVNDLGGMAMRYTFEFLPQPYEISIIDNANALPAPSGVGITALVQPTPGTFGFNEAGPEYGPFGTGTFLPNSAIFSVN
jgi:hypothetical protein